LVHGWEKAQQIQKKIQGKSKSSFVMMGIEVIHALKHLNCHSIAIASTYYSQKMSIILHDYLAEAGLNIIKSDSWQSQDKEAYENIGSGSFIGTNSWNPMDWKTPVYLIEKAIKNVAQNSPDVDCILVTGGGMRLLDIAEQLEKEVQKPIIGGDLVLYWGILRRLSSKGGIKGHGRLLASLVK
jgi:maleate cis-trans isomerase